MSGPDPFDRGRAAAEERREVLEDLREDVAAIVREEVARAGISTAELERMIRDAVGREAERATRGRASPPRSVLAAGALLLGLALGAFGYRTLTSSPPGGVGGVDPAGATTDPSASVASDPVPESEPPPGPTDRPTATERAALYDSLFEARSARLEPLVERLETAGPTGPVGAAISTWRSGAQLTSDERRRLHDALVQLALNELTGEGLALDGLLTRGPCRGNSCGLLLRVWRERGAELGMPDPPPDPATDDGLEVAERVLVLGRLEAEGAEGG